MFRSLSKIARTTQRITNLRAPHRRLIATKITEPAAAPQGPISWKALAVFCGIGTGGLAYYSIEKQRQMEEVMRPKTVGKAAIGGPFELVGAEGKLFTEKDLLGRWSLVYFGFTMCPDICPEELTKVSDALQILQKHGRTVGSENTNTISPVFISIDPERDSPDRSDEYAKNFHKGFVGLSGSVDQVAAAAKTYRVYFSKDETSGDDYLVDHSIITYLMDPNGDFSEFYGQNASATEIAARIESKMLAFRG